MKRPAGAGKGMFLTELGFETEVDAVLEMRGIYTGDRLKERQPVIYRACIRMLQQGVSASVISQLLEIDIRTVNAVCESGEKDGSITPYKERTVWALRGVIGLAIDGLLEKARKGKLSPLDVAVLIDKVELLSGGATVRVEKTGEDPDVALFREAARKLRDVTPGMGLEAGKVWPMGLGAAGVSGLEGAVLSQSEDGGKVIDLAADEELEDGARDNESPDLDA